MTSDQHLTAEEKSTNLDTLRHIMRVRNLLDLCVVDLLRRGERHDLSKLERPEVTGFANAKPIHGLTYGSQEWKENCKLLEDTLVHHYARNSHHPQHYKNGVNDMTLLDVLEMLVDWKASSERHNDGNILKSIESNAGRFEMSPQLTRILENTAAIFDG